MRLHLTLPLVAALTMACNGKSDNDGDTDSDATDADQVDQTESWDGAGYWLIQFLGDTTETDSTEECTENYIDAECEDGAEGEDSDWTYEGESSASPGADVGQILKGLDGQYYLYWDGLIFPGTAAGGETSSDDTDANFRADNVEFEFEWRGDESSSNKETFRTGKFYSTESSDEASYRFTLDVDLETGTATGTWRFQGMSTRTWRESDEWDTNELNSYGNMNNSGRNFLDSTAPGGDYNYGTDDDCDGDVCRVAIESSFSRTTDIQASFISADDGQGIDADIDGIGWGSGAVD